MYRSIVLRSYQIENGDSGSVFVILLPIMGTSISIHKNDKQCTKAMMYELDYMHLEPISHT